jgi:hypothetical protein
MDAVKKKIPRLCRESNPGRIYFCVNENLRVFIKKGKHFIWLGRGFPRGTACVFLKCVRFGNVIKIITLRYGEGVKLCGRQVSAELITPRTVLKCKNLTTVQFLQRCYYCNHWYGGYFCFHGCKSQAFYNSYGNVTTVVVFFFFPWLHSPA